MAESIRVGVLDGDIPVLPPLVILGSFISAMGLAVCLGQKPFLPWFLQPVALRVTILAVFVYAFAEYHKAGANALHNAGSGVKFTPVKGLATKGLYSFTRNPLYLLVSMVLPILSVVFDTAWLLIPAPLFVCYLHFVVIPVEEAFLEQKFGKEYLRYCETTPRWLF